MRQYGRKFVDRYVSKKIAGAAETRDAVLWEIDIEAKVARVKIQGSAKLVTAHYPRNWFTLPYFMKIGNAVRITHRGGVRGYVEISGEGRSIPQPVSGSALPPAPVLEDAIISGMEYAFELGTNRIIIQPGTYRINEHLYTYAGTDAVVTAGPMVMDVAPVAVMDVDYAVMDQDILSFSSDQIVIPNGLGMPAKTFVYYAVFVGIDGPHVVKGVETTGEPAIPDTPPDEIRLCYVLSYTGKETYSYEDLNRWWDEPEATSLKVTNYETVTNACCPNPDLIAGDADGDGKGAVFAYPDSSLQCECTAPTVRMTATVMNQYGWVQAAPAGEVWQFSAIQNYGTGHSSLGSTGQPSIYADALARGPSEIVLDNSYETSFTFTYSRQMLEFNRQFEGYMDGEQDPLFSITLANEGYSRVTQTIHIELFGKDETAGYMPPEGENSCYIVAMAYDKPVFKNFGGSDAPTQLVVV